MAKQPNRKTSQRGKGYKDNMPADTLFKFWAAVAKDHRITVRHIGLYAALLCIRHSLGDPNPMYVYSHQVMAAANMVTPSTYHQYVRQLAAYGYIRYEPSFKKNQASKIYFFCD